MTTATRLRTAQRHANATAQWLTRCRSRAATVVLGICEWGQRQCEEWCEEVGGQLWRTSYDVRDMWKDIVKEGGMGILDIVNITAPLAKHARPGQWPDMDMLVVGLRGTGGPSSDLGGVGCTQTEYQTQMSMWCMLSSVLAMTNDLRKVTDDDRRILLNKEIIAINQDALGKAAERIVNLPAQQVYIKPLADGSHAVAILNPSDEAQRISLQLCKPRAQRQVHRARCMAAQRHSPESQELERKRGCA